MPEAKSQQAAVNAAIAAEDAMMAGIVRLLDGHVPLNQWPVPWVDALRGALAPPEDTIEAAKAERLMDHLFLDLPGLSPLESGARNRASERIRADLADLVPYGAGIYLVEEDAAAKAALG